MNTRKANTIILLTTLVILAVLLIWATHPDGLFQQETSLKFDGQRALQDVETQVNFGARTPKSDAHAQTLKWMRSELASAGWRSEIQISKKMGHTIRNLVAYRSKKAPEILLGAHYDSRIYADKDPDPNKRQQAVPGANDGASGVAVLLELARVLPKGAPVWLVFFDAEDNGNIEGWDWVLGSRAFVEEMPFRPKGMVLVDMVGDADLRLPMEKKSTPKLRREIWEQAATLGYGEVFVIEERYSILDDHVPFLEAGIPAVNIIDIEYPYWHTTSDTADKVSADSLQVVGETLQTWLVNKFKLR